jgi:uncharacterized membrane-anchored protein
LDRARVEHLRTPLRARHALISDQVLDRIWVAPVAVKVPEIIALFWVVKVLTTAGGEATSDYLATYGNVVGGGIELLGFAIGLILQFGTRRYRALAYWWLAFSIAIFGTGVADFLHLDIHISYGGTSVIWAVILGVVFWFWHRLEGTLSIHSVHSRRRELFYWATVFATFALGTAFGDYTSKPHTLSGMNLGNGPTAAACFLAVAALVIYLAVARPDIQQGIDQAEV